MMETPLVLSTSTLSAPFSPQIPTQGPPPYPGNFGIGSKTTTEKVLEAVVLVLACLITTMRSAGQVLWLALFTG